MKDSCKQYLALTGRLSDIRVYNGDKACQVCGVQFRSYRSSGRLDASALVIIQ